MDNLIKYALCVGNLQEFGGENYIVFCCFFWIIIQFIIRYLHITVIKYMSCRECGITKRIIDAIIVILLIMYHDWEYFANFFLIFGAFASREKVFFFVEILQKLLSFFHDMLN